MNFAERAESFDNPDPGSRADQARESHSDFLLKDVPRPPSHLNKYAKAKWKELLGVLVEEERAHVADLTLIEIMCENYGIYREAKAAIHCKVPNTDANGYKTGGFHRQTLSEYLTGRNSQTTPELTAMNRAFEKFHAMAKEFGISPLGRKRTGQKVQKPNEDSPFRAYVRAMNEHMKQGGRR